MAIWHSSANVHLFYSNIILIKRHINCLLLTCRRNRSPTSSVYHFKPNHFSQIKSDIHSLSPWSRIYEIFDHIWCTQFQLPHITVSECGYIYQRYCTNIINIHKTNQHMETVPMTLFTGRDHHILLKLNVCQLLYIVLLPPVCNNGPFEQSSLAWRNVSIIAVH